MPSDSDSGGPPSEAAHARGASGSLGGGSLLRSFPHHPEIVLGVLVVVLGFDGVAGQSGGTRELHVLRVARLWVDALIGPPPGGTGPGSVRAGRESVAVIALANGHVSGGGFSTVVPCVRSKHACGFGAHAKRTSGMVSGELARSADHPAPPSRSRLAPAADALAGPFAQEWRFADQARLGLGFGVPPGARLLVVVVHRTVWFFCARLRADGTLAGRGTGMETRKSTRRIPSRNRHPSGGPRVRARSGPASRRKPGRQAWEMDGYAMTSPVRPGGMCAREGTCRQGSERT